MVRVGRILRLPQRVCETVDNANRSVGEIRMGVTSIVLPLKILLWMCIVIVVLDVARGQAVRQSIAYRMVSGAVDQLWYTIFYFSVPFLWRRGCEAFERFGDRRDWIVVRDKTPPSPMETDDAMREWVIVDWPVPQAPDSQPPDRPLRVGDLATRPAASR